MFNIMNKAHIISIGNELLIGDTINTNASWIGKFLHGEGFDVEQVITLPDDYSLLDEQLRESMKSADLVITTGGLGPTHDDITKKVVTDYFGVSLVTDQNVLNHIKKIFELRGLKFSHSNADQALVPENANVLFNKKGTAPGLWLKENGSCLAVLPGVPHEMKYLLENEVRPRLDNQFPERVKLTMQYFHTAGVPESTLSDDLIGDLTEYFNNGLDVAFLPGAGGVKVRVEYTGSKPETSESELLKFRERILERAGDMIYGEGRECDLASVVGQILAKRNLTISVAESCTGGRLSDEITNIPGCSRYMAGGVIAYSNRLKINMLGVKKSDLDRVGAVSAEVALQMAKGVAERTGASIGVSTTGVAGPGGGTAEKPVGTVWMGFWLDGDHFALKGSFTDDREINKQRTAAVVLETVRRRLLSIETLPYNLIPVTP
ncbi:competence/damage-inducible protein A [Rhodohalobacter sp. SW132]|nr:competence/damage-inducible protein A [Rhodohalobacter sp. SW132]